MGNTTKSIFVVCALVSLLGAGCNSQDKPQTSNKDQKPAKKTFSGKVYDPCALLTTDDVKPFYPNESITVQDDKSKQPNVVGQRICFFDIGEDMKFVQLSIVNSDEMSAGVQAGGQTAESMFNEEKKLLTGTEDLSGLGDAAYYGGNGLGIGKGTHVLVKSKSLNFTIDIGLGFGNTDKQKHLDIENTLAKKVLERL